MTPSAISQTIKRLEEEISCPLFIRSHQKVSLTTSGEVLFQQIQLSFNTITDCIENIRNHAIPSVTISSPPLFANQIIIPALQEILAEGIEFDFRLDSQYRGSGIIDYSTDIVIAYGAPENTAAEFAEAGVESFIPVCSQQYYNQYHDKPDGITVITNNTNVVSWSDWQQANPDKNITVNKKRHFSQGLQSIMAAVSGLGVLLESRAMLAQLLENGALVDFCAGRSIPVNVARHFMYISPKATNRALILNIKTRIKNRLRVH